MIYNKEKNILMKRSNSKEISELKKKILLDRLNSNKRIDVVTEDLMINMTDEEVFSMMTTSDNTNTIVSVYEPFISDYNRFIKLMSSAKHTIKYLPLLNPHKLQKYYGRKSENKYNVFNLICDYLKLHMDVPYCILTTYVNCSIHGRWFFSKYSHIAKILDGLMLLIKNYDMDTYNNNWQLHILPAIFEFLPYQYANYGMINYKSYYDMGGKFIYNTAKDVNIVLFLKSYIETNRIDELPLIVDLVRTSTDDKIVEEYKKLIIQSLHNNGNNIKLITWGDELSLEEIHEISDIVTKSISPLTNFEYYHVYYSNTKLANENAVYNTDFINALLKRGLDYSTLHPWINCLYYIEEAIANTNIDNLKTYMIKNFPNPVLQRTNEQELKIRNMNDYIVQVLTNKMSTNWKATVLYPVVFRNKDIFESLSPASIQYITRNIDFDEVIKTYPEIVSFPSIYETLKFSDVEHMASINHNILKYVPFHLIPSSVLTRLVINTKSFIPLNYTNRLLKISATSIIEMMAHDCGYGYILDLPTRHQIDAIVEYYIN